MTIEYSVCKIMLPGGNLKMSASEPATADAFESLIFALLDLGSKVVDGRHPKDSIDGRTNIPMYCPGRYPDFGCKKSPDMRWAFGVVDWDCAGTPADFEKAVEKVRGLRAFVHTTAHHSAEKPSYRIIVALPRPIFEFEIEGFLKYMNDVVGGGVNLTAKDVGRRFFVPFGAFQSEMLWDDTDIELEPKLFAKYVVVRRAPPAPPPKPAPVLVDPEFAKLRKHNYVRAIVAAVCKEIEEAPDGTQNTTIFKAAARLGGLLSVGVIDAVPEIDGTKVTEEYFVERLLEAAARGNHPDHRAMATIGSGLSAGLADPNVRPLDDQMASAERSGLPRRSNDRIWRRIGSMKR